MRGQLTERRLLAIVGAIQFVNVLDFMMVLPLGPDFARALGIPTAELGLVGGSYTAAAALSGILGALVLDRFDRRQALAVALGGLALGTLAGAFAGSLASMLAARILAGAFGGPTAALSLAVVGDVVPPERRGRAMGAVMGAFAVSSVLGVPAALEIARLGSWRSPFFAVSALGAAVAASAFALLPPLRRHLEEARPGGEPGAGRFLLRPGVALTLLAIAALMTAQFALVPNIAAFWEFNLGYPRDRIGLLFIAGGAASFAAMRVAGWLADRLGVALTTAGATALYVAVVLAAFVLPAAASPLVLFMGFMVASSVRMVPIQALSTRVPDPEQRARFMSAQSAVQHLGAATGAFLGAGMLHQLPDGRLGGMDGVAWLAVALASAVPGLSWLVERRVRRREGRGREARATRPAGPVPLVEAQAIAAVERAPGPRRLASG